MSEGRAPAITTEELAERLRTLGFLTVPHGHHLGVRGALYTSVRVAVNDGHLELEPRFGAFARVTATVLKTFGASALAATTLAMNAPAHVSSLFMLLALSLWGYDGLRYTLTESSMAQIRQAFTALLHERSREVVPETTMAALHAPPPLLDPPAFSAPKAEVRR